MNQIKLKNDFYKRCGVGSNHLVFSKVGALCTLLGHKELKNSEFLSCTLSMSVQTAAHRVDSGIIKIEDNRSGAYSAFCLNSLIPDKSTIYKIVSRFSDMRSFGAEILYDSALPQGVGEISFNAAILNSLLKLADIEKDITTKAAMCAGGQNIAPYTAVFSAKKGYCSIVCDTRHELFPLPITGYKILLIQTETSKDEFIRASQKAFYVIRRHFPHVTSFSAITPDILEECSKYLRTADIKYLRHIISENARIENARKCLKSCLISRFAEIVNASQTSLESCRAVNAERQFIANILRSLDGCLCARQEDNTIAAIVYENAVDSIINNLRFSFTARFGYEPLFYVADTCDTN